MGEKLTPDGLVVPKFPKTWKGATLEQLIASAKRVADQSRIGGSEDPRLPVAKWILRNEERLKGVW